MEEFIYKTVSEKIMLPRAKAKPIECVASRMRNSNGFQQIKLDIDGVTSISISSETFGDALAESAIRISTLLREIASIEIKLGDS